MCWWHVNCLLISAMGGDVRFKKNRKVEVAAEDSVAHVFQSVKGRCKYSL